MNADKLSNVLTFFVACCTYRNLVTVLRLNYHAHTHACTCTHTHTHTHAHTHTHTHTNTHRHTIYLPDEATT